LALIKILFVFHFIQSSFLPSSKNKPMPIHLAFSVLSLYEYTVLFAGCHFQPSLSFAGRATPIEQHILDTNAGKQLS
jgi:hypothetical protein